MSIHPLLKSLFSLPMFKKNPLIGISICLLISPFILSLASHSTLSTNTDTKIFNFLVDHDGDGIEDEDDLDDDNDGIPDRDECNGTFLLDGSHVASVFTATDLSSLAGGTLSFDVNLLNGITFNTGIGPSLANFDSGKPAPYNGAQTHLWLEINTDKTVADHGTLTLTFPSEVVDPTLSISDLSSNFTSPNWSLSLISQNPTTLMNIIYTDGDFQISGDTIRASENPATNGTGIIEFTGIVKSLQFKLAHYSESNQDGPVRFTINTGYTLCADIDSDGVASMFDLDSDNDGIYDVDEAGHSATDLDFDGAIDGAPALFGVNGLFNSLETIADNGILNYVLEDSENSPDGNADVYDLDSDGDDCHDVLEAGYMDGDKDGILGSAPVSVDSEGKVQGTGDGYAGTLAKVRDDQIVAEPCGIPASINPLIRIRINGQ